MLWVMLAAATTIFLVCVLVGLFNALEFESAQELIDGTLAGLVAGAFVAALVAVVWGVVALWSLAFQELGLS